jgi:hypothetical protein
LIDRPQPYTFTLQIDPEPFQVIAAEWRHGGFETVTNVEIQYDGPTI